VGAGAVAIALLAGPMAGAGPAQAAEAVAEDALPIRERNIEASRAAATQQPRSEADQAVLDGWPLYRTDRGQEAFNAAMATLKATDLPAPARSTFSACVALTCTLKLPSIGADGWIPAGRIWVSSSEYVLFVHSPRLHAGQAYRRRTYGDMRYFVFHEFHNSTHNLDPYDTISSHSGGVFVPLYMSKTATDARGRSFVIVLQVAPYDVVSIHASNKGSAGPGMEVAKNPPDALEPLQGLAGILVATLIKAAAPHLQVVNHQDGEGLAMLGAYERRLAALKARPGAPAVALPFVPAPEQRVAAATGRLEDLITPHGVTPRLAGTERTPEHDATRGKDAPGAAAAPAALHITAASVSLLAEYVRTNLAALKRRPELATVLPEDAIDVAESPGEGVVYVLNAGQQVLGRFAPLRTHGAVVADRYVFVPRNGTVADAKPLTLDVAQGEPMRAALLAPAVEGPTLLGPIRPATRPAPHALPQLTEPITPAARPARQPGSDTGNDSGNGKGN
jgi:hypothetical protein